jgi:hypothetical protein
MQDGADTLTHPLSGLSKRDWLISLNKIVKQHGTFKSLGSQHFAALMHGEDDKETLLVTFETMQGIRALTEAAQPLGWDMAQSRDWTHLCLCSDGDTWFREPKIWDLFDQLSDDGFFDSFEKVVFYGAGPCGYAAAAYSIAAPGSTVVMVQPQASLDPAVAEWDDRFVEMRKLDFTSRYGNAAEMIEAAEQAFVIYDPQEPLDAMHAALFSKPHVTKLRMRRMGGALQSDMIEMGLLKRVLIKAASGSLTLQSFAEMARARRKYPPYLRRVLQALDASGRADLALILTRNVTNRMNAPRFQRRLNQLQAHLDVSDKAAE